MSSAGTWAASTVATNKFRLFTESARAPWTREKGTPSSQNAAFTSPPSRVSRSRALNPKSLAIAVRFGAITFTPP